jgi:hypothetical protein
MQKAGKVAQAVKRLPHKHEDLSSNTSTTKKKKRRKKEKEHANTCRYYLQKN